MNPWDAQYAAGAFRRYPNEMLVSWVCRTYGQVPPAARQRITALELGCGAGANLAFLEREGFSVCGLDDSLEAMLHCRARGLSVLQRDVRDTGLPEAMANFIVETTCLQHLTEADHQTA